eukprot:14438563-Ditylum_brightwellii.AAC.1
MNINFPYASKHREKGFSFHIPKYVHALFALCKKYLVLDGRFLRKWSGKTLNHHQNMGHNLPRTPFCRMIEMHFGRQSGAVALVDAGICMSNSKRVGRWASILELEQYMEHNCASKTKRVTLLNEKRNK